MYTYLEMNASHYDKSLDLWKRSEGINVNMAMDSKEKIATFLNHHPDMCFVCLHKESGDLVGCILSGFDGRRGFIVHLAVEKTFRGNSIGKNLVQKCLDEMKKKGAVRCLINVVSHNEDGKSFWKKIGWKERDDVKPFSIDF